MTVKQQLNKLKENWLIIVLIVIMVMFLNLGGIVTSSFQMISGGGDSMMSAAYNKYYEESAVAQDMAYRTSIGNSYYYEPDFAPQVEERVKTMYASLNIEVENGQFESAEQRLETILANSDTILVNENINKYGEKGKEYFIGYYQIKINTNDYERFVSELRTLGETASLSENVQDITGQYTNAQINLQTEKERLERYKELYKEAETSQEKLEISDRIFQQERTIRYLEESIENMDQRVDYSTVNLEIREERPKFADIEIVNFKELARNFVDSLNGLITLVFVLIPWLFALAIITLVWKKTHK